ncbi:MAG: hypothetical protein B7Y51_10335 [Burkholderiales bacterium 28-67-8]|nr:MAG: hypothetical protein B7Y51_10335 [Burkholderiales bacterium 28-67-8]
MVPDTNATGLAAESRRLFVDGLVRGLPAVSQAVGHGARRLVEELASPPTMARRRSAEDDFKLGAGFWLQGALMVLRGTASDGLVPTAAAVSLPVHGGRQSFSLVDNETIEAEILSSRLSLAIKERVSWEFNDLRLRIVCIEGREDLDANDILRPEVLARIAVSTWRAAGLNHSTWRTLQGVLHDEVSHFAAGAYHEANVLLMDQGILPEIDLRPFIRRPSDTTGAGARSGVSAATEAGFGHVSAIGSPLGMDQDTRLMTAAVGSAGDGSGHVEAVLGRLNRLIGRHATNSRSGQGIQVSADLDAAITRVQHDIATRLAPVDQDGQLASPEGTHALLDELRQHRRGLKASASTADERATIEVVALLFQSILTEDRIPAAVRVWFARLQMPVLRVAVGEPDFFATSTHPARRLIDCMGACVMGFDANNTQLAGGAVEKEIKRVVQVVEAYPDTGSRVFQTVLTEFERFLEHYFKNENEASRKGVSLAEQVEQRETLAIQFTIELRKMLNEVPVQDGVREFLFHVWADVLAMTAVKSGLHSEDIKAMKRTAAELIWSASAKVSQEERADVIRRLPPLLKVLREGMDSSGVGRAEQDEHIQHLNQSLAAAFTARTVSISKERLDQLMDRLETLEELLPDADDLEIDESLVLDLSAHESGDLEVVASGGSTPTPAMNVWARELQVGSWFMLDYRNRNDSVQLAWRGMHRQLSLFVSPQGRAILFQQQRLAAFLQAGLLVPVQDESLMERATRSALAKLEENPGRLLN